MEQPTPKDLQELIDRARKVSNKFWNEESRRLPLPPLLFHATPKGNLTRIMREGLNPSTLIFENKKVVSLSNDPEFALAVAAKWHNIPKEKLALIWVETSRLNPNLTDNYLRKPDFSAKNVLDQPEINEVHYRGHIPPEWLADERADLTLKKRR